MGRPGRILALTWVDVSEPAAVSVMEVALAVLLRQRGRLTIAQVGANDCYTGGTLQSFLMEHSEWATCLLLEPQGNTTPILARPYDLHPDATVVAGR